MKSYDFESSHAFIETCDIKPYKSGNLDNLRFAVKDIIDVDGFITGFGNPSWKETHKKALSNACCVDQLLSEGAHCIGKTHTDEFAFSLLGENHYYGTPINPRTPDRVPGGSSSGSVSAVACGVVDFSLGTDTGGSIRVPASNCGVFGFRPSHGRISVAGVHPFAPTFDTVGVFSNTIDMINDVAQILLASEKTGQQSKPTFYVLEDAFQLSDDEIQETILKKLDETISYESVSFSDIFPKENTMDFKQIFQTYCTIQWAEIWNTHGYLITYDKPQLGPHAKKNFHITEELDRSTIQQALRFRWRFFKTINEFLDQNYVLLIPTSPTFAPLKGSIGKDRRKGDYYPRTLGLTAISGLARLPQLSIPFTSYEEKPIGLSLLMKKDQDEQLLSYAKEFLNKNL